MRLHWLLRQREYLKATTIKSDEIFVDQPVARLNVLIDPKKQQRANRIITIKTHPFAVTDQDQKKIQQQLILIEAAVEAVLQKSMRDKTKSTFDSTNAVHHER